MKRSRSPRRVLRNTGLAWAVGALGVFASAGRLEAQCRSTVVSIPDNTITGVSDNLAVATSGIIGDLNVSLDITHTWVGDLIVILTHIETTTSAILIDRPGIPPAGLGCGGHNIVVTLDDAAASAAEDACAVSPPAIGGTLRPNNPLSIFNGENIMGNWTLNVTDRSDMDTGTLNGWCLIVTMGMCTGPPTVTAPAAVAVTQTVCN